MHRLLIPLLVCLFFGMPALLRAQVPHEIQHKAFDFTKFHPTPHGAEAPCGSAGTFTFGQFNGHSNDGAPSPIFLCYGDSILVTHDKNSADLSGDPDPSTPAGIAFGYYICPPSVSGPTLQDIIGNASPMVNPDPCLLPGSMNGIYETQGIPDGGSTWFYNDGTLQNTFNGGQPLSLYFAPITVDNFATNGYESNQVGFPPGPCVAADVVSAFQIVYLNEITATGISNGFGNDCIGRFTVRGGYPQFNTDSVYKITITKTGNPSVKAIIHTSATNLYHLSSVSFSVPMPGMYDVTIEDGKSCPAFFQIDMNVCDPTDNLMLAFPDGLVPPGGQICVPITVQNFDILSGSFSVNWDPSVLQYDGYQNLNPVLTGIFDATNLNTLQTANGFLGMQIFNNISPTTISIPDGQSLMELCFTAVGALGDCTGIGVTNNPTGVALEDDMGQNIAISVDTGQICIGFQPLTLTTAVIDTTCLGQATLQICPLGGVTDYEIIVHELPSGPTYSTTNNTIVQDPTGGCFHVTVPVGSTNNTPLTYDICVQDNFGNGMTQCTTVVVNIKRLGAQINFAQQPLCNGDSTGIINAVVLQGGIIVPNPGTGYTYAWSSNAPSPTSQVQNGVAAGLYTVTVTDLATGCTEVASGSLGQPAPLSPQNVAFTPASCSGVCDGSIVYTAEGGVSFPGTTYQYSWIYEDTGLPVGISGTGNPITLNNACGGEYRIKITDANGCMFIDSNMVLDNTRELTLTQTAFQNVLCNGQSNGSLTAKVTESVQTNSTYTFTWSPAGFTANNTPPTSTYSNLKAGTYTVSVVDNLGCKAQLDDLVVSEPAALVISNPTQVNPICAQVNSGTMSVTVSGGASNIYTYAWAPSPPLNSTGASANNAPPGTYTVTVTDQNMCTATQQFVLPVPAPPVVTITPSPLKCGGDGSLTASSPTGFIYVWTDINGMIIDSTATIDTLLGGDYIVHVFDSGGCLTTDTATLASVTALSFSDTTLTDPKCFGDKNGTIAIGIQDGQPPYVNYQWMPAQTPSNSVIFNLAAGTYKVTVTDNVGCTLTGSFVLNQPPELVLGFDPAGTKQVSCFGVCDGHATPVISYNPPQPKDVFVFSWSDGNITDSVRTDLCAGSNRLIVTDTRGCFDSLSVFIPTPTQVGFSSLTINNTKCYGDSTGSATIVANGGNGAPYTYIWNTGSTTGSISNVPAGVYTTTLTDKNGCTHSIDTINVGQPAPILLTTSTQGITCFGGNNGQATVTPSGGTPNYTYHWEDAMGNNAGSAQTAEMLEAGSYDVTVTDANHCTAVTSETLQDPPPVNGEYEPLAPLTCNGDETILNIIDITGGSGGPYRFSVDFGAVLDPSFPVTLGGGDHYITYIDVKDCMITDSIFIAEPAPITVTFDPAEIEVELGATAQLQPIITGAAVIGGFSWTNPKFLLNPDTLEATAYTFSNLTYTLTVQDTFGCSGSGSITINIDPNRNVYLPNIFFPDNPKGKNDHFNINTGLGVEQVNFFRVYDRWGELMYVREKFLPNNDDYSEGWDGRYNGQFVNPGVFVYVAEVKFLDGRVLLYRGDVTVIR